MGNKLINLQFDKLPEKLIAKNETKNYPPIKKVRGFR